MTERHVIAYVLIALMIAAIGYGIHRWRRVSYERRHPHRLGSTRR